MHIKPLNSIALILNGVPSVIFLIKLVENKFLFSCLPEKLNIYKVIHKYLLASVPPYSVYAVYGSSTSRNFAVANNTATTMEMSIITLDHLASDRFCPK